MFRQCETKRSNAREIDAVGLCRPLSSNFKAKLPPENKMNRRNFMQSFLAAGVVSAVPGLAFALPASGVRTQTSLLMGTTVSISVVHPSAALADEAIARAFERVSALESTFNRHDPASAIGLLNSQGHLDDAPAALCALLDESLGLHRSMRGAFDISVAPLVDLLESGKKASRAELAEAKALADISAVRRTGSSIRLDKSGMSLTLDGIAKGAITDEAAKVMRAMGVENFLLNAGGDIYAAGHKAPGKSWKVAVESPEKDGNYPAILELTDLAVATSGGYERPGHLVNPQNGMALSHYKSVTVTAPSVKQADALATGLSALPLREAMAFVSATPGCSALFIDQNGKVHSSNWA